MANHEISKQGPQDFEVEADRGVKFGEFTVGDDIRQIAGIKGSLLKELAEIFEGRPYEGDWTVDELGKLIGVVGSAKTLQDNIPAIKGLLPGEDGKKIAIEWVKQSGLLDPVFRNFENPHQALPEQFDTVVITGGVRNWMMRRAQLLIETAGTQESNWAKEVLLVAGTRQMKTVEGPDVIEDDTEATYMARVIVPMLEEAGLTVRLNTPDTASGNEIAKVVAEEVGGGNVLVACNAGNWVQNGGQIRRAMGGSQNRLFVVSDSFPVAENDEPPAVAQNPLTAVGIIARNLQELQRHIDIQRSTIS